jgi:hypothetical protein
VTTVTLIDEADVLSDAEKAQLQAFITNHCLCRTEELKSLKHVKVRDDGNSGYSGYWSAQYTIDGADIKDVTAVIILNAFYLKTVEQMERTLAHEYGHHWTLYYFMDRQEMIGWFNEAAPRLYYRIRYSKGWSNCDKEVLAEDYKHIFTPHTNTHRMQGSVGNPIAEVKDYIDHIGKPIWR